MTIDSQALPQQIASITRDSTAGLTAPVRQFIPGVATNPVVGAQENDYAARRFSRRTRTMGFSPFFAENMLRSAFLLL